MKSIVLYGSPTKLTKKHKLVTHELVGGNKQPLYYVRIKVVSGTIGDALYHARPMRGETVLNTVEVETPT